MAESLKDLEKRCEDNIRKSDKLKDSSIRNEHNSYVLEKYRVNKGNIEHITLNSFFQISKGPTLGSNTVLFYQRSEILL